MTNPNPTTIKEVLTWFWEDIPLDPSSADIQKAQQIALDQIATLIEKATENFKITDLDVWNGDARDLAQRNVGLDFARSNLTKLLGRNESDKSV